jgi:hypothetical protein
LNPDREQSEHENRYRARHDHQPIESSGQFSELGDDADVTSPSRLPESDVPAARPPTNPNALKT